MVTSRSKTIIVGSLITAGVATILYFAIKVELEPLPGPQTHKQRRRLNRPRHQRT